MLESLLEEITATVASVLRLMHKLQVRASYDIIEMKYFFPFHTLSTLNVCSYLYDELCHNASLVIYNK